MPTIGAIVSRLRVLALLPLVLFLAGCQADPLNPSGDVALQQRNLLIDSTLLMLVIIVPVMIMIITFAWRYRQSNTEARYDPDWDHSTHLELAIWAAPLLIIICLGALTWVGTHLLDPYRQLSRLSDGQQLAPGVKPLNVEVVSLDWKWLFIYPDYGIATVNEMAAPVNTPIDFRLTSASVMNAFYVPALAGMIYTMPGMETKLHAVINKPGTYNGISANYSGAGFSGMHFDFKGLSDADFEAWVNHAKAAGGTLDRPTYLNLERPSENEPVRSYAAVGANLYDAILNLCVEPGRMCEAQMAAIDARGGMGLSGAHNTISVADNKIAPEGSTTRAPLRTYVADVCTAADPQGIGMAGKAPAALPAPGLTPLKGAGLVPPEIAALRKTLMPPLAGATPTNS